MNIVYLLVLIGVFLIFEFKRKKKVNLKEENISQFKEPIKEPIKERIKESTKEQAKESTTNSSINNKSETLEQEKKHKEYTARTNYIKKENFWGSIPEKNIYNQLLSINAPSLTVLPHVALKELFKSKECDPENKRSRDQYINTFHVDFLICEKENFNPLIAIEFDGGHHKNKDQQLSDAFKDELFRENSIPLIRFNYSDYKKGIIIDQVKEQLKQVKIYCRLCGSEMVYKTGKDGKSDFFGCGNYTITGCRYKRKADFKYVS